MTRTRRIVASAVLAGFAAVAVAGCGGERDELDFTGVEVVVGSRDFTEQYLLSAILVEALDEFGATVVDATGTGDITTTRAALESGEIDAYWEYNSAALVEVFDRAAEPDADGADLTAEAREIDAANGISWIGRSTFNNTYGFALDRELGAEHEPTRYTVETFDLDDLAGLLDDEPELVVCVEDAFVERSDGLTLFEEHTGFEIPDDQLRVMGSTDEIYPLLDAGECDVGEVFTTDGQIDELDLLLVEDPGVFLVYNASLTIRDEVYEQAPDELDELVDRILAPLGQSRMTQLNGRVAAGEPPSEVAADFVDEFVDP